MCTNNEMSNYLLDSSQRKIINTGYYQKFPRFWYLTQRQLSKREIHAPEFTQCKRVKHALLLNKITNLTSGNV